MKNIEYKPLYIPDVLKIIGEDFQKLKTFIWDMCYISLNGKHQKYGGYFEGDLVELALRSGHARNYAEAKKLVEKIGNVTLK